MFRQFQYDIFTEPPTTLPENVTADRWAQPQSQPIPNNFVKKAAGYACALVAATGLFWSTFTPVVVIPSLAGGVSSSVNRVNVKKKYASQVQSFFWGNFTPTAAPVAPSSDWIQPQNQPFPAKKSLATANQQAVAWHVSTQTENVVVSSWVQPQTQPYAKKQYLLQAIDSSDGQSPLGLVPASTVIAGCEVPDYSYFVFGNRATYSQSFFWSNFTPAAEVIFTNWLPTYPDRTLGKKYLQTSQQQAYFSYVSLVGETITVDKWFEPAVQPQRPVRRQIPEQLPLFESEATARVITPDFIKKKTNQAVYENALSWIPVTEVIYTNWLPSYQDIVNKKAALPAFQQQAFFWNISTQGENVVVSSWVQPQTQPFPARKSLAVAEQLAFFWHVSTQGEFVTASSFVQPQSQPYPAKASLSTANQTAFFWHISSQENVTADKFIQPQSQPHAKKLSLLEAIDSSDGQSVSGIQEDLWKPTYPDYFKQKQLNPASQLSFVWHISTQPENVVVSSWAQPIVQPYPFRKGLATANQQATFWNTSVNQETITYVSPVLPEPRRLVAIRAAYEPVGIWSTFTPVQQSLDWYQQNIQPLVAKKRLQQQDSFVPEVTLGWDAQQAQPQIKRIAPQQLSFTWAVPQTQEVVSEDKWHHTQSQPYPYKKALQTSEQQAVAWGLFTPPETVFAAHWGPVYPQPFPKKLYPSTAQQLSFFWNTSTQTETITEDKWHFQNPQPYPYRPYRPAAIYPNFFWHITTQTEVITVDKWFEPTSQPYPAKKALAAAEQLSFIWHESVQPETVTYQTPIYPDVAYKKQYLATANQQATFWNTSTQQENVSVDKFGQPTSQPTRRVRVGFNETFTWSSFTPAQAVVIDWLQQQNQPSRKTWIQVQESLSWSTFTPAQVTTDWLQQQNQPGRRTALQVCETLSWSTFTPAQAVVTDWYQQTQQPVQNRKTPQQLSFFWGISTVQEVVSADKFAQPQSQPLFKQKYRNPEAAVTVWVPFTPVIQVSMDWLQITQQPYPKKKTLLPALEQAFFWNISTQGENVVVSSWVQPQTQPFPAFKYRRAAYDFVQWVPLFVAPTPVVLDWYTQTNQPYPYRKAFSVSQQRQAVFVEQTGYALALAGTPYQDGDYGVGPYGDESVVVDSWAEVVSADRWAQPQSQPYPYRSLLSTAIQLAGVWNTLTPPVALVNGVLGQGRVTETVHQRGTVTATVQVQGSVDGVNGQGKVNGGS